jgi:aromatic ring-cleaving dioxygenase
MEQRGLAHAGIPKTKQSNRINLCKVKKEKKMLFVVATIFASLLGQASAHPSRVSEIKFDPKTKMPVFQSFHLHVFFYTHNNNSVTGADNALLFRNSFSQKFNVSAAPDDLCKDDFDNGDSMICLFPVYTRSYGPFPTPQWAAFFRPALFQDISLWAMQHRGVFDILIHPNSGYEFEDHALWPVWGGQKHFLDFSDPEFTPKLLPLPCLNP